MFKIFLMLGIVIIISLIAGVILIIIDRNQERKKSDIKLSDEVSVIFNNDSLKDKNITEENSFTDNDKYEEDVELEII